MVDISVIICTFDPDLKILERCLNAVRVQNTEGLKVECFLVDNNSPIPLATLPIVKQFLDKCSWAKLLVEKEQGLTFARLCGFRASEGPLIVFFDDDNEPHSDYLVEAANYAKRKPSVGAFGPGHITVEFTDPVEDWLLSEKPRFQETKLDDEQHSCITEGYQDHYPVGTGLVLRREILLRYEEMRKSGQISTSDRKGKSLASWGDIQLVWIGLKMGLEAGRTPRLKIRHLINGGKANRRYLLRHAYGCAATNISARLEVFPEERPVFKSQILSRFKATLLCVKMLIFDYPRKDGDLILASQIGTIDCYSRVFDRKPPWIATWLRRKLRFD